MNLAIVDPDADSLDVLRFAAERQGNRVVAASSFDEIFGRLPFEPHAVVLDLSRANHDARLIDRAKGQFPNAGIFVALEHPQEPLPTALLSRGVNGIALVPYNPTELVLRLRAWFDERARATGTTDWLRAGDIEVALDRYIATKNGTPVPLTRLELRLLYCLCQHAPHLTPTERLLNFGWDTLGDPDPGLIKTHISHIRRKLSEAGGLPFEIPARQTLGYALVI